MNPTVKILFYAINGTGLGHLSRLLNVARKARELLHSQGLKADFQFLTTSEAPQLAWDFPVYKLPSKTLINECDSSNQQFSAQAKFMISNLCASFRPDILVLDTVPEGSFNEFLFIKDYARATVFINRHKNESATVSEIHKAHLALYDLILVPDHGDQKARYSLGTKLSKRSHFCGPIHGFVAEDSLSREDLVEQFAVADQQKIIYISAGGGGDPKAQADLKLIIDALSQDQDNFLIVGYGPLFRGQKIYRSNVIPYSDSQASQLFSAVDYAISAAGYNSFQELLAAKVPTLFFAQEKGLDRQDERVLIGEQNGWNLYLPSLKADTLTEHFSQLQDCSQSIKDKLSERPVAYGSLNAALEILKLHSSLKRSPLSRETLYTAWQSRFNYYGTDFVNSAQTLALWREACETEQSRLNHNEEALINYQKQEACPLEKEDLSWASSMAEFIREADMPLQSFKQFLKFYCNGPLQSDDLVKSRQRILAEFFDRVRGDEALAAEFLSKSKDLILAKDFARSLSHINEILANSQTSLSLIITSLDGVEKKMNFEKLTELLG